MSALTELVPRPPAWRLEWDAINDAFTCIRALAGCAQDPAYHAEGDVWIHTRMVMEALVAAERWRSLAVDDRAIAFWGALFHDIGKPARSRTEQGRIVSRGHSATGENMVRILLWRLGVPIETRERIAALVVHHQVPLNFLDRDDPLRLVAHISLRTRCDLLAIVAAADASGRMCEDRERLIEQVELFAEYCREAGCLDRPFRFPSDLSRFEYFRKPGRSPHYLAYDDTRTEVVVMSGLPGAGKDAWIKANLTWPVVSLDALREELEVDATDAQGPVIAQARERARHHLRSRTPFVWNATNLSRDMRRKCIDLLLDYQARVRIVYVEAPETTLRARNRERDRRVPDAAIDRMLTRWQVPDATEAHRVDWVVSTAGILR